MQAGASANETTTNFEMPDTPPSSVVYAHLPDGLEFLPRDDLFSRLLCLPTSTPTSLCDASLCDNPHLDHRADSPVIQSAIQFVADHADTRRIACVATPPSRDAAPAPNMYHPS